MLHAFGLVNGTVLCRAFIKTILFLLVLKFLFQLPYLHELVREILEVFHVKTKQILLLLLLIDLPEHTEYLC